LFRVTRSVQILYPFPFGKACELLAADGAEGQAGTATQPLKRRYVFVAGHGALGERDTP